MNRAFTLSTDLLRVEAHASTGSATQTVTIFANDDKAVYGPDRVRLEEASVRDKIISSLSPDVLVDATAVLGNLAMEIARWRSQEHGEATTGPMFKDPDPADDEVDGEKLIEGLVVLIQRYVALPVTAAVTGALWVIFTYCHDLAVISPLLGITSPQRRCGKTTLLGVLTVLVRRPLPASNVSPAVVFRAVEKYNPTLIIDEADTFLRDNDELRGILNSGHTKPTAFVIRSQGEDHEPKIFSTWAPKAIALIGELQDTLADRAIVIPLRRRAPGERVTPLRLDRITDEAETLRRQLRRWADDHAETLADMDPAVPKGLHDRECDNWRPLLAIAELAGPLVLQQARKAAVELSGGDDDAPAELLLGDIRTLFTKRNADELSSEDIIETLVKMEDRPWPEWRRGLPLSKRGLARLLKPFDVRPKLIRHGDQVYRGYTLEAFTDVFSRYLPPATVTSVTSQEIREKVGFSKRYNDDDVTISKSGESPRKTDDVTGVTVENPPCGQGI